MELAESVVEWMDVGVSLQGEWLIQGVTGTLAKGSCVVVVGPSGAGKSTLLSVCNLMRTPSRGSVRVEGRDVLAWDVRALRRRVGMVFQSATLFPGTVEDNLCYGLQLHGEAGTPVLSEMMTDVGLDPLLLTRQATELSGGQAQRVALGRTLMMNPQVLLLDEVTSALDVQAKAEVEGTMVELKQKRGVSLVWVSHDLAQARRVADEVWFMNGGRLIERASVEEFFRQPKTEEAEGFLLDEQRGRGR